MKTKQVFYAPITVAHRGASGRAPENTLAALQLAKESGAAWVEFDVMMLRDGEIIVMHDDTLERTTNGHGAVAHHTYEQIQNLSAGAWFAPEFAREPIPTLAQFLEELERLELHFILEFKDNGSDIRQLVKNTLDLIEPQWEPEILQPIFFSENAEILKLVRQRFPEAILGQVMDQWDDEVWAHFLEQRFDIACINQHELTKKRIHLFRDHHVSIACYTINDAEPYEELAHIAIDYIITDYPEFERALIK